MNLHVRSRDEHHSLLTKRFRDCAKHETVVCEIKVSKLCKLVLLIPSNLMCGASVSFNGQVRTPWPNLDL